MSGSEHVEDGASRVRSGLWRYLDDGGPWAPVRQRIATYVRENEGAAFESYGAARFNPHVITGDDLVSLTMLSIQLRLTTTSGITAAAAIAIEGSSDNFEALLRQIPSGRPLHSLTEPEFDRWLGPGSAGAALYADLRSSGVPRVACHKLMARKRPHLFPVRDGVVERALRLKTSRLWWQPWWRALSGDPDLVTRISSVELPVTARHLSVLRIADIAVWTAARTKASDM